LYCFRLYFEQFDGSLMKHRLTIIKSARSDLGCASRHSVLKFAFAVTVSLLLSTGSAFVSENVAERGPCDLALLHKFAVANGAYIVRE
jgi:hypothetical protein